MNVCCQENYGDGALLGEKAEIFQENVCWQENLREGTLLGEKGEIFKEKECLLSGEL